MRCGIALKEYLASNPEAGDKVPFIISKTLGKTLGSGNLASLWGLLQNLPPNTGQFEEKIRSMDRIIDQAFGTVRAISQELRPALLDDLGLVDAVKDIFFYIITRHMLPANYVAAYSGGGGPDGVKKMEKCRNAAYNLGRTMVALIKMNFRYPVELMGGPAIAYGTHTK